jgi:transposase
MLELKDLFNTCSEQEIVQTLHDLYVAGASSSELAKALDTTDVTIRNYFKKYNLPTKKHGGLYRGKNIQISEEEYKKYTTQELMDLKRCSQFTVYQLTKNYPSRYGREKKYAKK